MRVSHPEMSYEDMKAYMKWQFTPSDTRQYDYTVSRGGGLVSRHRRDDSVTKDMALCGFLDDAKEPEPLAPLKQGEKPVTK